MQAQESTPRHIIAARAAGLSPYMQGCLDAHANRPCNADDFSPWEGDRAHYVEGYRAETEAMLAAQHPPGQLVRWLVKSRMGAWHCRYVHVEEVEGERVIIRVGTPHGDIYRRVSPKVIFVVPKEVQP